MEAKLYTISCFINKLNRNNLHLNECESTEVKVKPEELHVYCSGETAKPNQRHGQSVTKWPLHASLASPKIMFKSI